MNFSEDNVFSTALIGFDLVDGPFLKWKKDLRPSHDFSLDLEEFAMNLYLAFKGGNDGMKPRAIMYEDFSIVAFPRGLELCCMFMHSPVTPQLYSELQKVAKRTIHEFEVAEEEVTDDSGIPDISDDDGEDIEEVKRIIVNLLRNTQMPTPELRRYFHLSNSQIWKVMAELEAEHQVARCGKDGRAILWTSG